MKFSIGEYAIIINHCYSVDEIVSVEEIFDEQADGYSLFERQVTYNRIERRKTIIKKI